MSALSNACVSGVEITNNFDKIRAIVKPEVSQTNRGSSRSLTWKVDRGPPGNQ